MAKYDTSTIKGVYASERDRVGRMLRRLRSEGRWDGSLSDALGDVPSQITLQDINELKNIKNKKDLLQVLWGAYEDDNIISRSQYIPRIDIKIPTGEVKQISVDDLKWRTIKTNIVKPGIKGTAFEVFFNELGEYYSTEDIINAIEQTELDKYEMQEFDYYDEKERAEMATGLKHMMEVLPDSDRKDYLENLLDESIRQVEEYVDVANAKSKKRLNTLYRKIFDEI